MTNAHPTGKYLYLGKPARVPALRGLRWLMEALRSLGLWMEVIWLLALLFCGLALLDIALAFVSCIVLNSDFHHFAIPGSFWSLLFGRPHHEALYQLCLLLGMQRRSALYRFDMFCPPFPSAFLPVFWLLLCAGIALMAQRAQEERAPRLRDILKSCILGWRSLFLLAGGYLLVYPLMLGALAVATHYFHPLEALDIFTVGKPTDELGFKLFFTVPVLVLPAILGLSFVDTVSVLHDAGILTGFGWSCLAILKNCSAFLVLIAILMLMEFILLPVCLVLFYMITFFGGIPFIFLVFSCLHTFVLFVIALLTHTAAQDIFSET